MISLSHQVPVSLEKTWRAWTDSRVLVGWDPDRVDGEIREGQTIVMHWDSLGASLEMEVHALRTEEELVLRTHRDDGSLHELRVRLQALGKHSTEIVLEVRAEMTEDETLGAAAGWHSQLRILERYLSLTRKARTSFSAFGSAVVSLGSAYDALSHPGRWLCNEDVSCLSEGQPYSITTRPTTASVGQRLSGTVLSLVEGRELALWCTELNGVIRLRALPLAGGRARLVGAQVIRWGEEEGACAIEAALQEGVDRLIGSIGVPAGSA